VRDHRRRRYKILPGTGHRISNESVSECQLLVSTTNEPPRVHQSVCAPQSWRAQSDRLCERALKKLREPHWPSGIASRFNLSLTVRSGTTRVQHRTMAEFTSARSGIDSPVKPMDRWAEPLIMESMESLGKILAGAFPSLYAPLQSRQKFLNRSGLSSVYRTVCWIFLCSR
jgi:hypothetical protein